MTGGAREAAIHGAVGAEVGGGGVADDLGDGVVAAVAAGGGAAGGLVVRVWPEGSGGIFCSHLPCLQGWLLVWHAHADVPGDAAARRDCSERSGGVAAMGRRANAAGRPSPARRCRRRTHGPRNQCCMPHRARTLDVSEQGQRLHRPATHAFGPSSAGWAARPGGAGQGSACCLL